ncbi:hypothetical protein AJ79_03521 [Helicocarpus griseus UAMH5409]|uniref:RNA polymerase II subunit B1 CTD phosphatase RPAP2 homolog n=1 Tax=Helicocarpus griseus UAMH5409 TaxID=1447875 RepID=A0A2B7XYG9_9EURO|nr:hypothetical protein AJ79_03521 [Helicocarpus griseus UAMH5409]
MANPDPNPTPQSAMKTSIPSIHAAFSKQANPPAAPKPTKATTKTNQYKPDPSKPAPNPRHLALALHHAHLLQARKDTESLILSTIESLLSYPTAPCPPFSAQNPSPTDTAAVKRALLPFQPSDYDNLILERNIDGRCGYVLCPDEHRKEDPKAKYRVVWGAKGSGPGGRGREMRVVPKEDIERWCSDACAERAMYVRVQLIERPAWEREGKEGLEILLLEEGRRRRERNLAKGKEVLREIETGDVEESMRRLAVADKRLEAQEGEAGLEGEMGRLTVSDAEEARIRDGRDALAMERGDVGSMPRLGDGGRVGVDIFEKDPGAGADVQAPSLQSENLHGGSIEGFQPSQHAGNARQSSETDDDNADDDDMLPTI